MPTSTSVRDGDRSLLSETDTGFWIIDRVNGRVVQVWQIFYSEDTGRWAVFSHMEQQVSKSWWDKKGVVM